MTKNKKNRNFGFLPICRVFFFGPNTKKEPISLHEIQQVEPCKPKVELGAIVPTLGKMSVIFWNSNGWNKDRCDKIAQVAQEEDADVI